MTVFLGPLWSSIKQIKAPYVFDWEQGLDLHAMQGNHASTHGEGEVSWVFYSCGRNLGYILELRRGWLFETRDYTPGYCRNSRKPMGLHTRCEMRPDSHALGAEEFRVPNQTRKEPGFA